VIFAIRPGGRIVDRDTHDQLLRRGGLYASLHDQHYDGGRVEAHCSDSLVLSSGEVVVDDIEPAAAAQ
jgi:ATP-binding cassette subfamily B protein